MKRKITPFWEDGLRKNLAFIVKRLIRITES